MAFDIAIGTDFNTRLNGGLVPLHWAGAQGKAGLVKPMLQGVVHRDV